MIHKTADEVTRDYLAGKRKIQLDTYRWTSEADAPHWHNATLLIKAIVEAQIADNQANTSHPFTMRVTPKERLMLKKLKARLGVSSQEKAVKRALDMVCKQLGL